MDTFSTFVYLLFIITVFPLILRTNATERRNDYILVDNESTIKQYIDVEISGGIVRGAISNVANRPANVFRVSLVEVHKSVSIQLPSKSYISLKILAFFQFTVLIYQEES